MSNRVNELGQPIGEAVPGWQERPRPPREAMEGRFCRLEPLDPGRHAGDLHEANCDDADGRMWTYLPYGPFATAKDYRDWVETVSVADDPQFHAVIDNATQKALGVASFLRIDPVMGVIEVGHIAWSPRLQRRPAATEAMYLMMARVFGELGYRRYEWKCDALNAPSRGAAERLGFCFEGIFRQAVMYKGRNRDTAWFSILDSEWSMLDQAYQAWIEPANFDSEGRQHRRLGDLIEAARIREPKGL